MAAAGRPRPHHGSRSGQKLGGTAPHYQLRRQVRENPPMCDLMGSEGSVPTGTAYAPNGTLPHIKGRRLQHELPLGETDSEHAFCWMLERLREAFPEGYPKQPRRLWRVIADLGRTLGAEGKFNFLLADGRHLYARC